MDDIAPGLLKKIKDDFNDLVKTNEKIATLQEKILSKSASYIECSDYAAELGQILAKVFQKNLNASDLPNAKMHYNIAQRVIDPMMRDQHFLISKATVQVQKTINKNAGIGLKVVEPKVNEDKIKGIIDKVSDAENFDDVKWVLDEPVVTYSQSIVDDAIKVNAELHSKAGMKPIIIRKVAGKCCEWCQQQAGTYVYPNVDRDVFKRHQRCRCTIEYIAHGKKTNL